MVAGFIILVAIAVALVPLVQFLPSQRQREIASLREHAAVSGLFVEFRDIPGRPEFRKQAGVTPGTVIYYGKRLRSSVAEPRQAQHWITHDGQWQAVGKRQAVPAAFADLPDGTLAASCDESSCGIYWVESNSIAEVDQICTVLDAWSEALGR